MRCRCIQDLDDFSQNKIENNSKELKLKVDETGNLILTDAIKKKLGLKGGAEVKVVIEKDRIELFPNIHSLAKVYIEPTSFCNLMCETCIRNTWEEPMGQMDIKTFDKLVEQLKKCEELQTVMFGGFGEPTFHKDILYMIGQIKSLGVKVEMITNGTLLDENMIKGLFKNQLDTLWVSFDGTEENVFESIREGANFKNVVKNLKFLKKFNKNSEHKIKVGIAFVVMKKNINQLANIDKLARTIGASLVSVSNVVPYQNDMVEQILCGCSVSFNSSLDLLAISLPLIDLNSDTKEPLYKLFRVNNNISIMNNHVGTETSKCKFIKERCTFIRWDGMVCPCMALLHTNTTYPYMTGDISREVTAYALGNIETGDLKNIWESEEYHNFRESVDAFDFSPCLMCGLCDYAEKNQEDCFRNKFPTCGGCLWGQGVIQCP